MSVSPLLVKDVSPETPLLSIVIPVHNAEPWIRETLLSVCLGAQCVPFEVIIVDDGSQDATSEVVQEVMRQQPVNSRLWRVENGGPSRARNFGWRSARGEWIQFLDSDDLLHPRKFELLWPHCLSATPDIAVVYSDWARLERRDGEWQTRLPLCSPRVSDNTLESLIRSEHFVPLGATAIRRQWLERVNGFREDQWVIEDVNLLIRLALAGGSFRHVASDFPVFLYRQRGDSLSQSRAELFGEGCYANAQLVEREWRGMQALTAERRILLGQIYVFAASMIGTRSTARLREVLSGVAKLVGPLAWRSDARRVLVRSVVYRALGYPRAAACERAYLRAAGPVRRWQRLVQAGGSTSPRSTNHRQMSA